MLSDLQLGKRIGGKLKAIRLKRNITQQSLAEASSISLSSLKKIENGEIGTFDSLLRVLRTLGLLESISALFMEDQMSPSEYYEMVNKAKKNTRKRAAGKILADKKYESEWQMQQKSGCSEITSEHSSGMTHIKLRGSSLSQHLFRHNDEFVSLISSLSQYLPIHNDAHHTKKAARHP